MHNNDAIREYVISCLTLVIDNEEPLYRDVLAAVVQALRDNGVGTKGELFEAAAGRGAYRREELELEIGSAVSDIVGEWVDQLPDGPMRVLLSDLLDLNDRSQWFMLGARYWPDDDDDFDDDAEEEQ